MENEHRVQRTFYDSKLVNLIQQEQERITLFKQIYRILSHIPEIIEYGKEINQPNGIYVKYQSEDSVIDIIPIFELYNIKLIYMRHNNTNYYYQLI